MPISRLSFPFFLPLVEQSETFSYTFVMSADCFLHVVYNLFAIVGYKLIEIKSKGLSTHNEIMLRGGRATYINCHSFLHRLK